MVLLILESLGSTELLFILVMALVFFGPRKLPQISRSLGKNLAEFRRASEEFKRTWDREANLDDPGGPALSAESSILNPEITDRPLQAPNISSVPPDQVVARRTPGWMLPTKQWPPTEMILKVSRTNLNTRPRMIGCELVS